MRMGEVVDLKKVAEEREEKDVESFRKIVENSIDYVDKARLHCISLLDLPFGTTFDAYVFFMTLSDITKHVHQAMEQGLLDAFNEAGVSGGEKFLAMFKEVIRVRNKEVELEMLD